MSGKWYGCDGKRTEGFHAPMLVSREGKPCPNVFLTRPGDLSSLTECPGSQMTGQDGKPFCAECEARKKRKEARE